MQPVVDKKGLMKKKIPTLVGLGILVVGLIIGISVLGTGTDVFSPRATAETTPEKIKLTNVTDNSFTVSFLTPGQTTGFVKYGTDTKSLKSQVGDDRDQLSGTVGEYQVHHITVRGLKSSTKYYYSLGTGSKGSFDNNGAPFSVQTAQKNGAPSAAKTAYGSILNESGSPANGVIVYLALPGVGEMSALAKSSGSWAIPLSNARKADGSGYAQVVETDSLSLLVQGAKSNLISQIEVAVSKSQPVATITLGSNVIAETSDQAEEESFQADETSEMMAYETGTDLLPPTDPTAGTGAETENEVGGSLGELANLESAPLTLEEEPQLIIDFEATESQTVATSSPTITGLTAPNVVVQIEVNSDTQINQELVADANGVFTLNIEELKETLEPGEHTATYSYTDPTTNEVVTKTITFTVEDPQLAMANTTETDETTPYGSGNPYAIDEASDSAQEASDSATKGGLSATRSAIPATTSAVPVSGSVSTTLALILGGLFFIIAGGWSYYLATQIEVVET